MFAETINAEIELTGGQQANDESVSIGAPEGYVEKVGVDVGAVTVVNDGNNTNTAVVEVSLIQRGDVLSDEEFFTEEVEEEDIDPGEVVDTPEISETTVIEDYIYDDLPLDVSLNVIGFGIEVESDQTVPVDVQAVVRTV